MQMEYRRCVINLLDAPGHQDFSEDTYRVLTAVAAADGDRCGQGDRAACFLAPSNAEVDVREKRWTR